MGNLAPTGANHSFQSWVIQGLDLKPLRWEDAQTPNEFGDFILVLS